MGWIKRIEVAKDGTRTVYHHWQRSGRGAGITSAHTHPDTDKARAACHACTDPDTKGPALS